MGATTHAAVDYQFQFVANCITYRRDAIYRGWCAVELPPSVVRNLNGIDPNVDASKSVVLSTPAGNLRIISATHSVMDRLIAAASWQDASSLEQAVLVATHQSDNIDWDEIDTWVVAEGITNAREVIEFYRTVRRSPPRG